MPWQKQPENWPIQAMRHNAGAGLQQELSFGMMSDLQMLIEPLVLDLIRKIYDAAGDHERWPSFLQSFTEALNGRSAALFHHSIGDVRARVSHQFRIVPEWQRAYEQYYAARNEWLRNGDPSLFAPGVVGVGEQAIESSELRKTEFYNDYLVPQGWLHTIGGTIRHDAAGMSLITVMGGPGASPFGAREIALFETLMPHLESATRIHDKLTGLDRRLKGAYDALDRLPKAVLLLERDGTLLFLNRAAETLLKARDGIAWTRDGLTVSDPRASASLRKLIAGVLETANRLGMQPGGVTLVPRPSQRRPYEILVAPLGSGSAFAPNSQPGIVVFLNDPEEQPLPAVEWVRMLFDLTVAEARMAVALAGGKTIEEAADEFGVSVNTARTQVKSILSKTGVRRQTELVRLLSSSLAQFVKE